MIAVKEEMDVEDLLYMIKKRINIIQIENVQIRLNMILQQLKIFLQIIIIKNYIMII